MGHFAILEVAVDFEYTAEGVLGLVKLTLKTEGAGLLRTWACSGRTDISASLSAPRQNFVLVELPMSIFTLEKVYNMCCKMSTLFFQEFFIALSQRGLWI